MKYMYSCVCLCVCSVSWYKMHLLLWVMVKISEIHWVRRPFSLHQGGWAGEGETGCSCKQHGRFAFPPTSSSWEGNCLSFKLTDPFRDLLHRRKVIIFALHSDEGNFCSIWYFVHWQSTLPNNVHNRAINWNSVPSNLCHRPTWPWYKSWSCDLKTVVFFHSSSETLCT